MSWLHQRGSPPRVRGTGSRVSFIFERIGITPACAGNSFADTTEASSSADHPRVCGEQVCNRLDRSPLRGSPPRVRGTAAGRDLAQEAMRITPACAGNSRSEMHQIQENQDHPRVCGEQVRIHHAIQLTFRITPACAGNRKKEGDEMPENADHPRVCGEQPMCRLRISWHTGSPPRVRGTVSDNNESD